MSYNEPDNNRGGTGPTTRVQPPQAAAILQDAIRGYMQMRMLPDMFPTLPHEAARYWLSHQEPQRYNEKPEFIFKGGSEPGAGHWQTPFINRVLHNLQIFVNLKSPQQAFVIQCIGAGYPWRGDDIEFYKEVIKNTDLQTEYIKEHGLAADGRMPLAYTKGILTAASELSKKMAAPQ